MTGGSFVGNSTIKKPVNRGPSRALKIIVGVVVALAIIGVIAIIVGRSSNTTPTTISLAHSVEYQVTGSAATVNVTYVKADDSTAKEYHVDVPWSHTFTAGSQAGVYISAQNDGESGSVTVTITEDGTVFKTTTSNGAHVIAAASGFLP